MILVNGTKDVLVYTVLRIYGYIAWTLFEHIAERLVFRVDRMLQIWMQILMILLIY